MSQKTKSFLASAATGLLFTVFVTFMSVTGEDITKGYFSHPFVIGNTLVLWFFYSFIPWLFAFREVPQGQPFLSLRLFKSFAGGLAVMLLILGLMFISGKIGGPFPNPWAIGEVKDINIVGTVFLWLLMSGLLFDGVFDPNKKVVQ